MPFWAWSKTAASNGTSDSTINWAEGMPPAQVNDSARAMMARTAEWRDDISGALVTSGTSTAYTLSTNQGFTSFSNMNNAMVAFVPHTTCGNPVTLNVDSLGAKPLRSAPSVELPSGTIVQGTPYVATYNNSDGAFYLQGFVISPSIIPIGAFLDYCGTTAPNSNFVLPYGQAISRTTYATLFSLISTTFGVGDGSTTFNIPDLRCYVCAMVDNNLPGSFSGRIGSSVVTDTGTIDGQTLGSTGGSPKHTLIAGETPSYSYTPAGSVSLSALGADTTTANLVGAGSNVRVAFSDGASTPSASFSGTPATINSGGGGAHPILQPTMMMGKILRVI